ncbi:MAG: glutathione peroxidase [Ahrensia sp.]|nr:glutathione peroxidase [Ahrensia sp.]
MIRRRSILIGGLLASLPAFAQNVSTLNAHSFTISGIDGTPMPLANFKGRVLLIVNTASQCSFTRQYNPLQALHEKYAPLGLTIIGVPSNDFGGQEPKGEDDIAKFVSGEYSVQFPMAAKMRVAGSKADPFYQWLAKQAGPAGAPRWNFHKYLIDANGNFIDWYSSLTDPASPKFQRAIEAALKSVVASN